MTDDRTEEALRRALHDAASRVNVPMGTLPEPTPEPSVDRPRVSARILAAAVIVVLALGSFVVFALRDDGSPASITTFGSGAEPITVENADVQVTMNGATTDEQAVRAFADASPGIAAYTYVSSADLVAEIRARLACSAGNGPTSVPFRLFRVRVADGADLEAVARALAALPGVTQVITRTGVTAQGSYSEKTDPDAATSITSNTSSDSIAVTPTTVPAVEPDTTTTSPYRSSTTVVPTDSTSPAQPTTTAAPAEPTTTAAPTSKEIPYVALVPADCTTTTTIGRVAPPAPNPATAATLPPAGDQPADPASAEQAIREMWTFTHDGSVSLDERFQDNLEDADVLLPLMKSIGQDGAVKSTNILGIQFVSPTRAAVLSQNVFQGGSLDVAQVQYVALIDGRWKWTRESQCKAVARAGVHCPEGP